MEDDPDNTASLRPMAQPRVSLLLKQMREEAGLSVQELADELGRPKSSYAYYEDADKFKKQYLPRELVNVLLPIFLGRGIPQAAIYRLAGPTASLELYSNNESDPPRAAVIDEIDVRAASGAGIMDGGDDKKVVQRWHLPRDLVRMATYSLPECIKIITVVGDSMEPTFRPFERVMVDTEDTKPSPGGIFVVWDGLGLVVKRVEFLAHSDPPTVRITSDNPRYEPYTRTLGEAHIQGRVLGRWAWV